MVRNWFPLARVPGKVGMHRWTDVDCWLSAGPLGPFRPHTHICRGVWVLALVQWPGAGLYPPVPPKPLSLAAMPDCSTPSSSPYPSFLFQIIFYNSPSLRNPSSLNYVFIFYTKSLIIKLFPPDLCASSSHLSSAPLSLSHTLPRAALSSLFNLPPISLWRSGVQWLQHQNVRQSYINI